MDTITEDESIARKEGIDDTTHLSRFQTYAVLAALVFAQVATGFVSRLSIFQSTLNKTLNVLTYSTDSSSCLLTRTPL